MATQPLVRKRKALQVVRKQKAIPPFPPPGPSAIPAVAMEHRAALLVVKVQNAALAIVREHIGSLTVARERSTMVL